MKYPLVPQDLFDRTVDAKTKDPKETFRAFPKKMTKKNTRQTGSTREQNILETSKNFAKTKEYKLTI